MWTDPVVDEIHQIRQKMLADVGDDIHALMAKFHEHQDAQSGEVIKGKLPPLSPAEDPVKDSADR